MLQFWLRRVPRLRSRKFPYENVLSNFLVGGLRLAQADPLHLRLARGGG